VSSILGDMPNYSARFSEKINLKAQQSLGVLFFALSAWIAIGFASILEPIHPPKALVSVDGWQTEGTFPRLEDRFPSMQIPQEYVSDPEFVTWRNWAPEGSTKGTVISAPFQAPEFMAVPFARGGVRGYDQTNELLIQCISSGATLTVSSSQTFGDWVVAYLRIPNGFCDGQVKLIAAAKAASSATYLGVGTPFSISKTIYYAHAGYGAKGLVVFVTWFLFAGIFIAACCINLKFGGHLDPFGLGAIGVGAAGMIVFAAGCVEAHLSSIAAIILVFMSALIIVWTYAKRRAHLCALLGHLYLPLFSWLLLAICLTAFLSAADNEGGWWAANALFSPLSWSTDNQLPVLFVEHFVWHHPIEPGISGGWFFDDRTPLLTVMLIIPQTLFIKPFSGLVGYDFIYHGDSIAAITILCMWLPVFIWFVTKLRIRSPLLFLAIVSISPFTLFNTLYTWAKIMGGAYVITAVGLMLSVKPDKDAARPNIALIPSALTLAFLAHSGNVIGALAFVIVFFTTLRMKDFKVLAYGTLLAFVLIAPWIYWSSVIQPGGNALARLTFANTTGFDIRSKSVLLSTIEALRDMGWTQWVEAKRQAFGRLFDIFGMFDGFGPPIDSHASSITGQQRVLDFTIVARAIGIASFGIVGLAASIIVRHPRFSDALAVRLGICSIIGLIVMVLITFTSGVTTLAYSYGSIMMLSIAGTMYLLMLRGPVVPIIFAVWFVYFTYVWIIDPLYNADRVHVSALATSGVSLSILVWALAVSRKSLGSEQDHNALWKGPTLASHAIGTIQRHVAGSLARLFKGDVIPAFFFAAALGQFIFFTWWTLQQPIVDMHGFRPAQTAISVPYMLSEGAWLANIVPVFGEPWVLVQEFPFYQWCVAVLVWATGASVDSCGRIVSAFFAIAALWPVFLLAKAAGITAVRRFTLLTGLLWLGAPVTVFWGRSFLIETTSVFVSLVWLAFYVRFLEHKGYVNYFVCLFFGAFAAAVKITTFGGFVTVGFLYTCVYVWRRRRHLSIEFVSLLLAGSCVSFAAAALILWGKYADGFLVQNPLSAVLRITNIWAWYFGVWSDRWSALLWNWAIRVRDLPEALGNAWYVLPCGLILLAVLRLRAVWISLALVAGYLSVYMFFPVLHINNSYYQVENVILLCAAAVVVINSLLNAGFNLVGYVILVIIIASQAWTLHTNSYGIMLRDDLRRHPYYLAGLAVKETTPTDSVIVVFGTGWGADVPYYADRHAVVLPDSWPVATIHQMLFEQRDTWFGGRKLGAVVDCAVFDSQRITSALVPIRDTLIEELSGEAINIEGSFYGATVTPPSCRIFLPRRS